MRPMTKYKAFSEIPPSILVVDDEKSVLYTIEAVLKKENYHIKKASSATEAIELYKNNYFDLVITDLTMPGPSGMDLLEEILDINADALVILITAYGSESLAVEAMKKGAYDYLPKPFANDDLRLTISRALEKKQLIFENEILRDQLNERKGLASIIGSSEPMQNVYSLIEKVAPNDVTVLVTGETGTGKELVASAIHQLSNRHKKAFVKVNCAALPENLIESELFGHERGAFTGAINRKIGKFELADNGTIFLDEIGEMSMTTQTKILRILQEKEFERIGGNRTISVNTRIITATNQNLEIAIKEGRFREDLFYRLNVINISLPALRERLSDIPALVKAFSTKFSKKFDKENFSISKEFMGRLMQYPWPGNVRELQNLIERVVILEDESVFQSNNTPGGMKMRGQLSNEQFIEDGLLAMKYKEAKEILLKSFEKKYFKALLENSDGNVSEAARNAGMHRKNLYLKLKDLEKFNNQ